nr:MAG TPA: hypothetical protein [Caudoviricetes sp.]
MFLKLSIANTSFYIYFCLVLLYSSVGTHIPIQKVLIFY